MITTSQPATLPRSGGSDMPDGPEPRTQPPLVGRPEQPMPGPCPSATTVFLVDDHELFRRGVREVLEAEGDVRVVGEAGSVGEALAKLPTAAPDVAVVDVRLPDGDGVDLCREIRARYPETPCLLLTAYEDDRAVVAAAMAGAAGVVSKQVSGQGLVDAVQRVASGKSLPLEVLRPTADRLRGTPEGDVLRFLTSQERRIVDLIGDGLTNREVGERIGLAEKTVKNYVSTLLVKLGMRRRTEVAALAARVHERRRLTSSAQGGGDRVEMPARRLMTSHRDALSSVQDLPAGWMDQRHAHVTGLRSSTGTLRTAPDPG